MSPWRTPPVPFPPLLALVTVLALLGPVAVAGERPISDFGAIYSISPADYDHYQLKFTYLGLQTKLTPTMGATAAARAGGFVLDEFRDFERDLDYGNDMVVGDTLMLGAGELLAFVGALAAHPELQDTTLIADPHVSLMVLRGYGPAAVCWEHLTPDDGQTAALFDLLHDSVLDPDLQAVVDRCRHHMAGVRR